MINYDLFKEIELYATRHLESSKELYAQRNQNIDQIFGNILAGKMAEFSCYQSMIEAGYIMENEPDLKIYSSGNKSHDADLICLGKEGQIYKDKHYIHVKSISLETFNRFGVSFLLEKSDILVRNPQSNHYYSVMLQQSLSHYIFHKWICSLNVKHGAPKMNLPSKYAVYL